MNTARKFIAGGAVAAAVIGTSLLGATAAQATYGHGVYVQDYIASCEKDGRTTQFVLDANGADTDTTYTISDGTPGATVVVGAHSTGRSPVFSIPASGAHYWITASTGQSWSFTAAPDCVPVPETPVETAPPVDPAPTDEPVDPAPTDDPDAGTPGPVDETPIDEPIIEGPETPATETPADPQAPATPAQPEAAAPSVQPAPQAQQRTGTGTAPVATPVEDAAHFTG